MIMFLSSPEVSQHIQRFIPELVLFKLTVGLPNGDILETSCAINVFARCMFDLLPLSTLNMYGLKRNEHNYKRRASLLTRTLRTMYKALILFPSSSPTSVFGFPFLIVVLSCLFFFSLLSFLLSTKQDVARQKSKEGEKEKDRKRREAEEKKRNKNKEQLRRFFVCFLLLFLAFLWPKPCHETRQKRPTKKLVFWGVCFLCWGCFLQQN